MTSVTVRPGVLDDLPALTAIYNHYVETSNATFDVAPFSVEQRRTWFDHYSPSGRHRLLVAERSGEVVGYATSSPLRPKPAYDTSVETTIYCREDVVGLGLGRQLYDALLTALDGEDLHRAYAGIALPNDASVALHEAMGFTVLGTYREVGRKFGRYWDVRWFERSLPYCER
ncbi:GNAT family N-acetyltransferase [Angustibacter peucedani]